MSQYALALIDDQPDERNRVLRYLGPRFVVGVGASVEDALHDLRAKGRKWPDLWLVDMYFPEGPTDVDDPATMLHNARGEFLKAEAKFYGVLARLRQTSRGGFREAQKASSAHRVPVALFSRKGTLDDAIEAYEHKKIATVMKKPDPALQAAEAAAPAQLQALYDAAFDEAVPRIASKIEDVIHGSKWLVKYGPVLTAAVVSFITGVVSSGLVTWVASLIGRWRAG